MTFDLLDSYIKKLDLNFEWIKYRYACCCCKETYLIHGKTNYCSYKLYVKYILDNNDINIIFDVNSASNGWKQFKYLSSNIYIKSDNVITFEKFKNFYDYCCAAIIFLQKEENIIEKQFMIAIKKAKILKDNLM